MKKQLLNLNSHDAYTALGYAAGRFKVTVESSQVHTRLATFRQNCGRFKLKRLSEFGLCAPITMKTNRCC